MPRIKDRTNQRSGRLLAIEQAGRTKDGHVQWGCLCACGEETVISNSNWGRTVSCGCYQREQYGQGKQKKHGLWKSDRWWLYQSAHSRATERGIPFAIRVTDIPEIPPICPILGIPLFKSKGVGSCTANSPTLDRIIPELGYVPGNIQIMSQRANVIKNDASADEVMKVAMYMQQLERTRNTAV